MGKEIIEEINALKRERRAVVLVHNYQWPDIYKIADFIGDSLELARSAVKTKAEVIVFCGVDFMAESAKILNPSKTVLLPERLAICPMAQMVTVSDIKRLRQKHPGAVVVSYINTTAEVKAVTDVCCTSANAVNIVNSLKEKEVIFTPDENLANYVQTKTKKRIISVKGFCYVHSKIRASALKQARRLHPDAKVVAHPECKLQVIKLADAVCSTSQMIDYCKKTKAKKFIIATEIGMVNRLKREIPEKEFLTPGSICIQMKKIGLESVKNSLEKMQYKINLPEEVMIKAKRSLNNMLALC